MKIAFMGTPDFSVSVLKALMAAGHEICGVVTQPDRPRGRRRELMPSPVKETALTIGILSRMELVLSMRLHGLIFAASQGVPLVGVAYDPKVTAFLDYAGQENHLPFENARAAQLCDLLDRAAQLRTERETLRQRAQALMAKECKNTEAAKRLLRQ